MLILKESDLSGYLFGAIQILGTSLKIAWRAATLPFHGWHDLRKKVTERFAMQMTVVYSCVRILSKAVAGLPLHLYKVVVIDFRYLLNKKDFLEF
ncbi:hypothetical protein [Holdemanella biformis]